MKNCFWGVFSETGDVLSYLLCRAAENAACADGAPRDEHANGAKASTKEQRVDRDKLK